MAFKEQISYQSYPDSSATTFVISDFYFNNVEYVKVRVYKADGTTYDMTKDSDWEIVGRTITRLTVWEVGSVLVYRDNAYNQLSSYRNAEIEFDRELLEYQLDYITMLAQQNQDIFKKSIAAPLFDTATDFELPIIAERLGKFITFDALGNVVVRSLDSSDIGGATIEWQSGFSYTAGWLVEYNGVLWIAVTPATGVAPAVGAWLIWTEQTYQMQADLATIASGRPQHTVYCDTTTVPAYVITLEDGSSIDHRVTVVGYNGGAVSVAGTGLTDVAVVDTSLTFAWNGTAWLILDGSTAAGSSGAIGTISWWPNSLKSAPSGSLRVDSSLQLIADYPDLYAVIGTTYGGDGVTNFQLPGNMDGIVYEDQTAGEVRVDDSGFFIIRALDVAIESLDFAPLYNAIEMPTYGEALATGELFLDGTKSFVSSDNRSPVVDVVDYFASKYSVDGSTVDEANSKWPGQRGTYGFFGEYENLAIEANWVTVSSTRSSEGSWNKLVDNVAGVSGHIYVIPTPGTTKAYQTVTLRKGEFSTNYLSQVYFVDNGANVGVANVDWNTNSFTFSNGAVDQGSIFIDDNTCIVKVYSTFSAMGSIGSVEYRLAISSPSGDSVPGDYIYFKDWMVVEDIDYAVPYTAGTHPASKLQYNFDWASSDEWTIEWLVKSLDGEGGTNNDIFDTTDSAYLYGMRLYLNTSGIPVGLVRNNGAQASVIGDLVPDGSTVNFKMVLESGTSLKLYQDGVLKDTNTTAIPIFTNFPRKIAIGTADDFSNPTNGYIQDLRITPTADTSTTHYDNGLPYYDPNKIVGKNGSWSIDEMGNIAGLPQVSGIIVEDYELDGQRVTKWDTGLMIISYYDVIASVNMATASGTLFRSAIADVKLLFTYVVPFVDPAVVVGDYQTASTAAVSLTAYDNNSNTSVQLMAFRTSTSTSAVTISWQATGRWK